MVYYESNSHKHPEAKTLKDFEPKVKEAPKSSFTTAQAFAVVGLTNTVFHGFIGGSK